MRHIARLPLLVLMPPLPLAVHGGELHPLEGDLGLTRLVVLELPPIEAARRFNASPEYVPLLRLRRESAASEIVLVEGWTPLG